MKSRACASCSLISCLACSRSLSSTARESHSSYIGYQSHSSHKTPAIRPDEDVTGNKPQPVSPFASHFPSPNLQGPNLKVLPVARAAPKMLVSSTGRQKAAGTATICLFLTCHVNLKRLHATTPPRPQCRRALTWPCHAPGQAVLRPSYKFLDGETPNGNIDITFNRHPDWELLG